MLEPVNNIVFLGAGASAADGAPVQARLLGEYFGLPPDSGRAEMNRVLAGFFRSFYGLHVNAPDRPFPTFEEALGILELALDRGETFKHMGEVPDSHRLEEIREHLIFLICVVLHEKLERGSPQNAHARLMGTIGHLKTTRFVSLNYDLLADNALMRAKEYPDYGVAFSNRPREPEPGRCCVGLYKLHGSLNWLRCPVCSSITTTGDIKAASYPVAQRPRCSRPFCQSATTPIVIPPTFFKVMSDFHLQQIWHEAELALTQCKHIFFCGYSLPDADMHIKYLLKRAEINRGDTPEVFVFNNHPGKPDAMKRDEEARYRRAFTQPGKVHYTDWSFEDFAAGGFRAVGAQAAEAE